MKGNNLNPKIWMHISTYFALPIRENLKPHVISLENSQETEGCLDFIQFLFISLGQRCDLSLSGKAF